MRNKKGLTAGQIILMLLAVLVLAILVFALTTGSVPLFGNIDIFGGGQVNAQNIVTSCQISCTSKSVFDYCRKLKNVVFEKGQVFKLTCSALEQGAPRKLDIVDVAGESLGIQVPIPSAGLPFCDTIDRVQCEEFTKEAMSSLDAIRTNSKLKVLKS